MQFYPSISRGRGQNCTVLFEVVTVDLLALPTRIVFARRQFLGNDSLDENEKYKSVCLNVYSYRKMFIFTLNIDFVKYIAQRQQELTREQILLKKSAKKFA